MPVTLQATGGGSVTLQSAPTANNYTLTLAATNGTIGPAFPSGTAMLFVQTNAPTGWTKSTANNNVALRVVSGTAGTGGSVAFTTAFASQTPAGSVSTSVSGTVGDTTLSITQIPSHTHGVNDPGHTHNVVGGGGGGSSATLLDGAQRPYATTSSYTGISVSNTGGGGSHTHSFSGSGSSSFSGTAMNLAVQYVDVIIATMD